MSQKRSSKPALCENVAGFGSCTVTVRSQCVSKYCRLPPGHDLDSWWVLFRSGAWRLYYQLSIEGRKRYFDEVVPLLHDTKAQVLGERDHDAWYLVYLGTKPSSQGRGYAGKLLKDVMQRVSLAPSHFGLLSKGVKKKKTIAKQLTHPLMLLGRRRKQTHVSRIQLTRQQLLLPEVRLRDQEGHLPEAWTGPRPFVHYGPRAQCL